MSFSPNVSPPFAAMAETGSVLVVEDEDYVADLMLLILSRGGVPCVRARDGAEALQLAAGNGGGISLAMVDLCLPDIVGDELCRQLRVLHPGLPVLLTSGRDLARFQGELARGGPTTLLSKPYRPAELLRQVRAMLPVAA